MSSFQVPPRKYSIDLIKTHSLIADKFVRCVVLGSEAFTRGEDQEQKKILKYGTSNVSSIENYLVLLTTEGQQQGKTSPSPRIAVGGYTGSLYGNEFARRHRDGVGVGRRL